MSMCKRQWSKYLREHLCVQILHPALTLPLVPKVECWAGWEMLGLDVMWEETDASTGKAPWGQDVTFEDQERD